MAGRYFGIGIESSWGVGVTPHIYLEALNDQVQLTREFIDINTIRSNSTRDISESHAQVDGSVEFVGNYQDLTIFFLGLFGNPTTSGAGPFTHTFPAAAGIGTRPSMSAWLQRDGNPLTWRYRGAMIESLSLAMQLGQEARATVGFVGTGEQTTPTDTGTHTGASNNLTIMTNSGAAFPTTFGGIVGWRINNTTDGSSGVITANTATTATVASLSGGTENDWDTGDAYTITPPTASYPALDVILPKQISVSFDGTALAAESCNLNVSFPVDRPSGLGSVAFLRQPVSDDVIAVSGDVTVLFEDLVQYNKANGSAVVDIAIVATSGALSMTLNVNKTRIIQATPHVDGRHRLKATYEVRSYFDTTATENIQAVFVNNDAVVQS